MPIAFGTPEHWRERASEARTGVTTQNGATAAMDLRTETLVKRISERVRASMDLLADFHRKVAEAEQRIEDSKLAIAASLRLLAKPLEGD